MVHGVYISRAMWNKQNDVNRPKI